MTKAEFFKQMQNLQSWKTWALTGDVPNHDEAAKIQRQINDLAYTASGKSLYL